jgi:Rrf2 family protein
MQINKQTTCAILVLRELAAGDGRLTIQELADRIGVPRNYMVVVTHALVRAELIEGRQAPRRGYALTKDSSEMRLFDTITALERLFPAEKGDTFPMRAIKEILRLYAKTAWAGLTIGNFVQATATPAP